MWFVAGLYGETRVRSKAVRLGFELNRTTMGQVLLRGLRNSPVTTVLSVLRSHISISSTTTTV